MSTMKKDKNIITIEAQGANGQYFINLSNGQVTGLRGAPIKTLPRNRIRPDDFRDVGASLGYALKWLYDNHPTNFSANIVVNLERLALAEKLDALHFSAFGIGNLDTILQHNLFPLMVKYLKTLESVEQFAFWEFMNWADMERYRPTFGEYAPFINNELVDRVKRCNFAIEDLPTVWYYLIKQKLAEYPDFRTDHLKEYFTMCKAMNKKIEKVANFCREYVETKNAYELYQDKYDNEMLVRNYQAKAKAFTFTFGEYSVFCPSSKQDIIKEGNDMRHCVGGYAKNVVNGDTYIVFIRKTATPDQCYITCQVHTDGTLGQYYLARDRHIYLAEDIAFKNAFARHLRENW